MNNEKKTKKSSFAAVFSICAVMFSAYVGPVMLIPLIVSVPYRLRKDKQDGIIDANYELVNKGAE